jgi:hypothetical protein
MIDPPAGAWFKEQAAELVTLAQPALAPKTCRVAFDVQASWPSAFIAQVTINNVGTAPMRDWTLSWAFPDNEQVVLDFGVALDQSRGVVTASAPFWDHVILPGGRQSFGFLGKQRGESYKPLLLFLSDGAACSVR